MSAGFAAMQDDDPGAIDFPSLSADYQQPEYPGDPDSAPDESDYDDDLFGVDDYDTASDDILNSRPRKSGAIKYQRKVNNFLAGAVALTAPNPATVADAATILIHGAALSKSLGDLAAENKTTAQVIDFIDGGTANPVIAVVAALLPFILQTARNHEPQLENITRISVPLTRGRLGFNLPTRIKLRIGGRFRNVLTHEPENVYNQAFLSPSAREKKVLEKLGKKGISVARYSAKHSAE